MLGTRLDRFAAIDTQINGFSVTQKQKSYNFKNAKQDEHEHEHEQRHNAKKCNPKIILKEREPQNGISINTDPIK